MAMALKIYSPNKIDVPESTPKETKEGTLNIPKLGNKILFISLGCPRNLVDSEVMLGILLKNGYEPTQEMKKADYIVINTCSFLEASRTESMATIEEVLNTKKKAAKLIVTGCMVQSHSDILKEHFSKVDYFLGSGDVEKILAAVQAKEQGEEITSAKSFLEAGEVPRKLSTPKHYAYLKISEGCRKKCAYCIIPNIKGPLQSKTIERVLKERDALLKEGVQEIILIAQDLGDYAKDINGRNRSGLVELLKEILNTDKKFWLRLLYLYPDEITDEMIALMKQDSRIVPYLDMPIQHINDRMLKSMRRMTSKAQIIDIIQKLRREVPDVVIRTSLIVGFPGETDEEFEELTTFIQEHPLDNVGIFKFSREEGSAAYDFPDQINEKTKQKRYKRLVAAQQSALKKWTKKWLGRKLDVIVEGYHPESQYLARGRFYGQCPEIDGMVILNDFTKVDSFGKIYTVEITDVAGYDLIGKVL